MKRIFILISVLALAGCEDYLGGDTNIDPNRTASVTLEALLPVAIESTANNHYLVALYTGQFSQHLASYFVGGSDSYYETRIPSAWTGIYLTALTNLDQLVKQAEEQSSPHYAGVGKILQAINLGLATDCWGDVPFTDAFKGSDNLTPSYDTQEAIYSTINTLLTDAIELLEEPNSVFKLGADDLAYGGGTNAPARWIKAAYALKARFALRYTKLNPGKATADALAAIPMAFTSNTDDLQIAYNDVFRNPWYNNVSSPIGTGNFTVGPSSTLVNMMNGTEYPGTDPRLPKYFELTGAAVNYVGMRNGSASPTPSRLSVNTFYMMDESILPIITYAEVKFIEAEARFLANGGTVSSGGSTQAAFDAYIAGTTANMYKLEIEDDEIATYIGNGFSVAQDAASLTLEHILKEKYIALFLSPEVWTDVRRYDYNSSLYSGMELPENYNDELGGDFIRRVLYPLDEINRNAEEVAPHVKEMNVRMWWN